MDHTQGETSDAGYKRRTLIIAGLVILGIVAVGSVLLLVLLLNPGTETEPQISAEPTDVPAIEFTATATSDDEAVESTEAPALEEAPTATPGAPEAEIANLWDNPSTVLVEHCQMSIQIPSSWRQGTNEYDALYIANYPEGSDPGPDSVMVELCPLSEGNFSRNGEHYEFPGGFDGEIYRGSIYDSGDPERDIDLLYSDNRTTWFLSATFEEPATEDNPATGEFFEVVDTIEFHERSAQDQPDAAAPDPGEPESLIDPLFLTYVCNDRQDPEYDEALDRWGYLTLGGKAVVCLELNNQNHEFVIQQQELLDEQIQRGEFTEYSHMKRMQEDSPNSFYRNAAIAGGFDPKSPFGTARFELLNYHGVDLLLLAKTGDAQIPSIDRLWGGIRQWADSSSRAPFGFQSAGQVLSLTLVEGNNHLARLFDGVQDSTIQYEILYEVVYAVHRSSWQLRWNTFETELGRMYDMYIDSMPDNLWFHEWLVRNPELLLARYWSSEDWTLPEND